MPEKPVQGWERRKGWTQIVKHGRTKQNTEIHSLVPTPNNITFHNCTHSVVLLGLTFVFADVGAKCFIIVCVFHCNCCMFLVIQLCWPGYRGDTVSLGGQSTHSHRERDSSPPFPWDSGSYHEATVSTPIVAALSRDNRCTVLLAGTVSCTVMYSNPLSSNLVGLSTRIVCRLLTLSWCTYVLNAKFRQTSHMLTKEQFY